MGSDLLTDREYWAKNFEGYKLFKFQENAFSKYLKKFLDVDHNKTCLEIGAFPGGFLGSLAKTFKYQPTALDFIDEIGFIEENMVFNGIDKCKIIQADFTTWEPKEKYDVVCSYGFVEHFDNYEQIIAKHVDALKSGGYLILSVPHLGYFQGWIRKQLYTKKQYEKIWNSHNLKIMNLKELERVVFKTLKMEKKFAAFVQAMNIWFPPDPEVIDVKKIKIYKFFKKLSKWISKLHISNRFISPTILIIARKSF